MRTQLNEGPISPKLTAKAAKNVAPILPRDAADTLMDWYAAEARDLPWRRTRDPYAILVSEVMLQQTRVETVLPRYTAFLRRFADLATLAAADIEEVLTEWSGLGYYRRARSLHAAARMVMRNHHGILPADVKALRALPGIGEYTAAAVSSIAHDLPQLAVDGNVARVLCRLMAAVDDPRFVATVRRGLEQALEPTLKRHPPGAVNQALMELGATVCAPRRPRCEECPCEPWCTARELGIETEIPPPRPQRTINVIEAAGVLEQRGRYLMLRGQRPDVNRDMWEFPTIDSRTVEEGTDVERELRHYLEALGLGASKTGQGIRRVRVDSYAKFTEIGQVRHGITYRRIRCRVFRVHSGCRINLDQPSSACSWLSAAEAEEVPLAASARKILRLLAAV